jgi:hypothetical protein
MVFGEKFCPARVLVNALISCVVENVSFIGYMVVLRPVSGQDPKRLPKPLAITSSISIISYWTAGRNSHCRAGALAIMDSYSQSGKHRWRRGGARGRRSSRRINSMTQPWDRPPEPKRGDPRCEAVYEAVGRALSHWEILELDLACLYAKFLGVSEVDAISRKEYVDARIFRERADVI